MSESERVRICFSTTPEVKALLDAMVETGLYGRNYHEAAERLLCEALTSRITRTLMDRVGAA